LVELLDDLPEADDPGWRSRTAVGRLQLLHHRVLAALTDLAVAEGDTVAEGWLKTFANRLTPDESVLLTRAASAPRRLATLFAGYRTTVDRAQNATDTPGATAGAPCPEDPTADDAARDDTADMPPNPILEIAEEYRDLVAELFREGRTRRSPAAPIPTGDPHP
jgi:hypothetical protein